MSPSPAPEHPLHPAAGLYAQELREGRIGRREFLTRVTSLGVSASVAYGLGGIAPVLAQDAGQASPKPVEGGTLRIQMEVRALKDPRTADWSEIANFTRGWLEYLVEYNHDGTMRGMLLEGWEVNEDATEYTLRLRPGVLWSTGAPFEAEDVVRMFDYWCDRSVEGNAMAAHLATLVDPETGRLREGAVERLDALTVALHLPAPDISIIAALSDYPAAVVHAGHDPATMLEQPVGTGPYLPESLEPGGRGVLVRNTAHDWWGASAPGYGGARLDRIEYIDYGTDPATWLAAIEADEIDMLYENIREFVELADGLGWTRSETVTGATVVLRGNQKTLVEGSAPYADVRVRRALQLAIDNEICLELGYGGMGVVAQNHHVAPVHPEYADIGGTPYDPVRARALMEEAGMADFEHEIVTLDDGYTMRTGDTAAALLNDAGIKVRRKIVPGSTFWNSWSDYPLSISEWNHRPLGVQVLALAYRSGAVWNESGYANPAFDAALDEALSIGDADSRREIMVRLETMLQEDAVIVQPFWRVLYRHARPEVLGAEMHPSFEIHPYRLGLSAAL